MTTKKQSTKKTSAKSATTQVINFVEITKSSELSDNVGHYVRTPKGKTFKVVEWTTAKNHGMNTNGTAYGSLMRIEQDGKERKFLSNPANKKAEGFECLTNFYNETGLLVCGKSGKGNGDDDKTTFEASFEKFKKALNKATFEEVVEVLVYVQNVEGTMRKEKEQQEADDALIASLSPEVQDLMRRRGLM